MISKAAIFLSAAVHFAALTAKGKYFLIVTRDKGDTGGDTETENNGGMNDYDGCMWIGGLPPTLPWCTNKGNKKETEDTTPKDHGDYCVVSPCQDLTGKWISQILQQNAKIIA